MKHTIAFLMFVLTSCTETLAPHPPPVDYSQDVRETASMITDVHTAQVFMRQFRYIYDGTRKFPTIEQCFERRFVGDCKTSAVMGKWALECTGRGARIIILYYKEGNDTHSHAIAISADNTIMIDGHTFGFLDRGADWVSAACSFRGKYEYLTDNGKVVRP